jgi:hypothetical protein
MLRRRFFKQGHVAALPEVIAGLPGDVVGLQRSMGSLLSHVAV